MTKQLYQLARAGVSVLVCHELTAHDGLLFKQNRVIVPSSLRESLLHKLYAAYHGSEFTLRHVRN